MLKKVILVPLLAFSTFLSAKTLDQKIANMFIIGFYGTSAPANSKILSDICTHGLGGVILFDRHPSQHEKAKNISSVSQLATLNRSLLRCSHQPLIAIDEEGGKVQRLRSKNGFYGKYPRASTVSSSGVEVAQRTYAKMAKELASVSINYNLAPIADVAINPRNIVISKLGRSYGRDPSQVIAFDTVFINQMHMHGVLTSLKHFPGHGSSLKDTHDGFVDITSSWHKNIELLPYKEMIATGNIDSIMVAHVFNRGLDKRYPASLSRSTIIGLLRSQLGYDGVVISDDFQMGAISKHYTLRKTIKLAINAGVDILLFGNQLDPKNEVSLGKLVSITKSLIKSGDIKVSLINKANNRIDAMKGKIGLGI